MKNMYIELFVKVYKPVIVTVDLASNDVTATSPCAFSKFLHLHILVIISRRFRIEKLRLCGFCQGYMLSTIHLTCQ